MTLTNVHFDMPAEAYHAIDAFSSSSIAKLLRSPAHYKVWREGQRMQTSAMLTGEVTHTAVLEPDLMTRYTPVPSFNMRTKDGKQAFEMFCNFMRAEGVVPVPGDDLDTVRNMQRVLLNHRGAMRLLDSIRAEVTVLWQDAEFDVPCKARIDGLRLDHGVIDVKTTKDAAKRQFMLSVRNYLYHAQAAHYSEAVRIGTGAEPPFFAWIAMEKEPPYGVAAYVCPDNALRAGAALVKRAKRIYAECRRTGEWPGYPETIEPLTFPAWALRTDEEV